MQYKQLPKVHLAPTWNAQFPPGSPVLVRHSGANHQTTTTGKAWDNGFGLSWVDVAPTEDSPGGGIRLEDVTPLLAFDVFRFPHSKRTMPWVEKIMAALELLGVTIWSEVDEGGPDSQESTFLLYTAMPDRVDAFLDKAKNHEGDDYPEDLVRAWWEETAV